MKLMTSTQIRKTAICIATAIAIAAPGLSPAALGDRVTARIQTVKTNTGVLITNVRERQPLANAIDTARESSTEVFDTIKDMHVLEQLKETVELVKQMQADYEYFSGGEACGATCASFRGSLKNIFNNVLELAFEVPALNSQGDLVENLQRVSNLIDYMPPRALYLMWQTMGSRIAQLESTAEDIRQTLASLPPLMDPASFGANTMSPAMDTSRTASSNSGDYCGWVNQSDKPVIDLIQARLERTGWEFEKIADLIPDVDVKAEGGASAGAAVANATASAAVGAKPTDSVKIAMKLIAFIPQEINWAIKLNVLRAKVVCSEN